ncbi:MAG: hypothetical protein LBJ31_04585 [Treponema sp.]|jgi:hypothetical protein|nr:hypothetical protein [Treponema sp.]
MAATKELFSEIEALPKEYLVELFDFVAFLKMKQTRQNTAVYTDLDEGYKAMAADAEREQEAGEWINGCFGDLMDA